MPKINQEEYEILKNLDDKWKWIARDEEKISEVFSELSVFVKEPYKSSRNKWWLPDDEGDLESPYVNPYLFQFIQWEDEEPYNITELIEEYEYSADHVSHVVNERVKALGNAWKESEETEVKNKVELKSWFEDDKLYVGEYVKHKINQLDEPEVLLQEITYEEALKVIVENIDTDEFSIGLYLEALSNNEKYEFLTEKWIEDNTSPVDDEGRLYVWKSDLLNVLVPKQELPVIPNYVAKWISVHRERFELYPALKRLENNALSWEGVYGWYRKNTRKFVNAYLTGKYEVEEEPKYIVSDNSSVPLLIKTDNEKVMSYDSQIAYNNSNGTIELTEQEIKDYDERYWAFAKPVEELEE